MISEHAVIHESMNQMIFDALHGEVVVHKNSLATVTPNWLIIPDPERDAQVVIAIERLTGVRKVTTTKPGLLVISCGLFTIAAGGYVSRQGFDISIIIAMVALLFVMGYVGTRRAAVLFLMGDARIETVKGSFREVISIMRAVTKVRGASVDNDDHS